MTRSPARGQDLVREGAACSISNKLRVGRRVPALRTQSDRFPVCLEQRFTFSLSSRHWLKYRSCPPFFLFPASASVFFSLLSLLLLPSSFTPNDRHVRHRLQPEGYAMCASSPTIWFLCSTFFFGLLSLGTHVLHPVIPYCGRNCIAPADVRHSLTVTGKGGERRKTFHCMMRMALFLQTLFSLGHEGHWKSVSQNAAALMLTGKGKRGGLCEGRRVHYISCSRRGSQIWEREGEDPLLSRRMCVP